MLYATVFHSQKKKEMQQMNSKKDAEKIQIFVNPDQPRILKHDFQKMIKTLRKNKIRFVVLSRELNKNQIVNKKLKENHIYAITGYRLFRALLPYVVEDICHKTQIPIEKIRIIMYMNEYSIENRELIRLLSLKVKQLTVISCQYKKYQKEVECLYEQYGCTVKLYDEDDYFPKKENMIINLNQGEEESSKIVLNPDSIYLSFLTPPSNFSSFWNGIMITDFLLKGPEIREDFTNQMASCEAKTYQVLKSLKENERIFFDNQYQIIGYCGKNGKITDENFQKIGKNFT